ncbi:MAG: hypothetical protein JO272_01185 [Pseudonocardiales bacterium]|nr:hypothetical protein [Pseudonocardiales bacterium]
MSTLTQRLAAEAAEAARVRDALTHPDVVALRVDRVRLLADRFIWSGIAVGLLFTMINVQVFAAQDAERFSLGWWGAWFLDPAVTVILLGVLIAEGVTSRWQVHMGAWARGAKWSLLAATYVMNTWQAWDAGWWAGVVLHSVPPLAVFVGAECRTGIQDKLTECVHAARAHATHRTEQAATQTTPRSGAEPGEAAAERPTDFLASQAPRPAPSTPDSTLGRPSRPRVGAPASPARRPSPVAVTDELLSQARMIRTRLLAQGKTAGRAVLRQELGVSERTARELVRRLDDQPLRIVTGANT